MSEVIYQIVRHEGGWAYKSDDVFSETFPSHEEAVKAAARVAEEQTRAGDTIEIEYQDKNLEWQIEYAGSHDRPTTKVVE
jgi:hypothetical protein